MMLSTILVLSLPPAQSQAASPPVNTAPPTITGTAQEGQKLTDVNGTWTSANPPTFGYQWQDCDSAGLNCVNIATASTSQTYVLTSNDVGHTIVVQESATDGGMTSGPISSNATGVVLPAAPTNSTAPTISGTAKEGSTLTEIHGTWTPTPGSYNVVWQDCDGGGMNCTTISSGPGQTYTLKPSDVNHTIVVQESATNPGGTGGPANSASTGVVIPLAPVNTGPPTISGTAQQGQTLTEGHGTWVSATSPTFSYAWFDCGSTCTPIPGATGQTYTLTPNDVGHTILVQESATNGGGTGGPINSALTAVVKPPPPSIILPPTISGFPQQGQTLVEGHGSWSNGATGFTYQWQDCDGAGANCVAILGANLQTYTLTPADVGHTIVVQETASNAGGTSLPASSAPTGVVVPPTPPPPPVNNAPPTIFGSPGQGQTLAEGHGSWINSPTAFGYQWKDCDTAGANCVAIPGATQQIYTLTAADLGHTVVVQEFAANAGGTGGPATSAPTGVVTRNASTTLVATSPTGPVTNENVILIATVTSSAASAPPSGSISFNAFGAPISGCETVPVSSSGQSATVFCQASFRSSASPQLLTAVFAPAAGSSIAASTSGPVSLNISHDSTSTALDVSNPTVAVGGSATYTATVRPTHAGAVAPSGSVGFLDGGNPIAGCGSQPLKTAAASLTATCTVGYAATGDHHITAHYAGDANFNGSSSSPPVPVNVRKLSVQVQGTINATMQWSFTFTPTYTKVLSFVVNGAPVGGSVLVFCRGGGCPYSNRTKPVAADAAAKSKPCKKKGNRKCPKPSFKTVNLVPAFSGHRLQVGTQITVQLVRPNWIGKNYRFTIRAGQPPRVEIACLAPGGTRPGVGC